MTAFFRFSVLGVVLLLASAAACGGANRANDQPGAGKAGVAATAGSSNTGGDNANSGGSAGDAGERSSGGTGDAAGSASAGSNTGGAQTVDATACETIDDCVIATVFAHTGCCARTDCGSAFNRDWVLNEPCASSDTGKDPVPQSCSEGCNLCPASHCTEPVGVACNAGKCQTISMEGPCTTDADCVLAIDYSTTPGACCSCTEVVSTAFEAAESCVELEGAAIPAGCAGPDVHCETIDCAPCAKPTPSCQMGRCVAR